MIQLENQTILVTSNEPWGDLWYSKQNYAYELSKRNKVYFINPPTKWNWKNFFSNPITEASYTENLHILNYENYLPIRSDALNRTNNRWVSKKLRAYLEQRGVKDPILWAFDPLRLYDHRLLGAKLGIYHCVDYYYFQYLGEGELCRNSDLLFATSQRFLDEYKAFDKPKHVVPHGISSEEFTLDEAKLQTLDIDYKDYGLYVGVIDHRLDFDLLETVIQRYPDIPFVFVGPLRLPDKAAAHRIFTERKYPNVHPIGARHFKQLKYYIRRSRFCTAFMDMNYHANTVHHHKTLVYLTQGKPVFGFKFSEYNAMEEIMYMDNTHEGLLRRLDQFIQQGESPDLAQQRIEYAWKYTFGNVLADAGKIIEEYTKSWK